MKDFRNAKRSSEEYSPPHNPLNLVDNMERLSEQELNQIKLAHSASNNPKSLSSFGSTFRFDHNL